MKRSMPLKNSGFSKSITYMDREARLAARTDRMASMAKGAAAHGARGVMQRVSGCVAAVPKEAKAKPGKAAPNKAEREWMDWIVSYGCICCRMDGLGVRPAAVHHMLRGGQRIGHLYTLPLCDPGHHQNGQQFGMTSRHPWKTQFERKYGTEDHLLSVLRSIYAGRCSPEHRVKP